VNISKPSLRAIATSLVPAASAVRMAKAVGAETATMIGPLITADFYTISTETRLVTRELIEGVVALACQARADGKVL
jgi:hypothetical protein